MDLQEYVEAFHRTEQETDVNRWTHDGIHLWPFFRVQAIAAIRSPESYFRDSAPKPEVKASLLDRYYRFRFFREAKADLARQLNGKKTKVLFYVKPGQHKDKLHGKWYDRFLDPFIELLPGDASWIKLQPDHAEKEQNASRHIPAFFFSDERFRSWWHYYKRVKPFTVGRAYQEMESAAKLHFNERRFRSSVEESFYYRALFREVLRLLSPQVVFFQGYYENDTFGLIAAAHELGIRTVDIQHGKQGVVHPMYTHWTKIPEGGYELLPDRFWNWGEESAENIRCRMGGNEKYHRPVVGGNLWIGKWKYDDCFAPDPDEQVFIDQLEKKEKVILYTLQPLETGLLPAHVIESIRRSPPGWLWLLRTHPFHQVAPETIRELLGDAASRVEIRYASSLPLYYLLRFVDHHLTLWSSTCFEAVEFGVPTTIVHEFGCKIFDRQIQQGVFSSALDADTILGIIRSGGQIVKNDYIETDRETAQRALGSLLSV